MKKIDELIQTIDDKINKKIHLPKKFFKKYFPFISISFLILLLATFLIKTTKEQPTHLASIIQTDLQQIEKILNKIDKDCNILGFNYNIIRIDFLNVEKFSGSTIGCLNLAYPTKWEGPYLRRNPTLQGKFYEIIKTEYGVFITPGQDVKLPNNLIFGKNVQIDEHTKISELIKEGGPLNYNKIPLARELKFTIGDWDSVLTQTTTVNKISAILKEFNEAIPFAELEDRKKST